MVYYFLVMWDMGWPRRRCETKVAAISPTAWPHSLESGVRKMWFFEAASKKYVALR